MSCESTAALRRAVHLGKNGAEKLAQSRREAPCCRARRPSVRSVWFDEYAVRRRGSGKGEAKLGTGGRRNESKQDKVTREAGKVPEIQGEPRQRGPMFVTPSEPSWSVMASARWRQLT